MSKHEYTHVGTVNIYSAWGGEKKNSRDTWLRGTAKRWYDDSGDWWPKVPRGISDEVRCGTETDYSQMSRRLDLSTVRLLTVAELREPLEAIHQYNIEEVRRLYVTINEAKTNLSESVASLEAFDRKHGVTCAK